MREGLRVRGGSRTAAGGGCVSRARSQAYGSCPALLGTCAELLTAEFGELRLQFLDRQLRDDEAVFGRRQFTAPGQQLGIHCKQQLLQFVDVRCDGGEPG